jgi:hypothetical protein
MSKKPKEHEPSSLEREDDLPLEVRVQMLTATMEAGIADKRPVDLSTPPHRELTEALHRVVYHPGPPTQMQVEYGDGSRGKAFPVHVLSLPPDGLKWVSGPALHLGTLTFRHVDYDDYVDLYLLRDRETRSLRNDEIEERAYTRMQEVLRDPRLAGATCLRLYQTGLEPLVVGAYRALVDHLRQRPGRDQASPLIVQPVFFLRKNGVGTLWG